MSERPRSLLVVDDDGVLRARLVRAFRERGFDVRDAASFGQALALAAVDAPEYALVELRLPDGSGLELVRRLREREPATVVVLLTAYGSIASALDAVRLGAAHYLTKPAGVGAILRAFDRAPGASAAAAPDSYGVPSLARVEWEHINRVLSDCGGNVSRAARLLGLHRRSLQRKLAKHPLPR